jgi:hypothetical protein
MTTSAKSRLARLHTWWTRISLVPVRDRRTTVTRAYGRVFSFHPAHIHTGGVRGAATLYSGEWAKNRMVPCSAHGLRECHCAIRPNASPTYIFADYHSPSAPESVPRGAPASSRATGRLDPDPPRILPGDPTRQLLSTRLATAYRACRVRKDHRTMRRIGAVGHHLE